MLTDRELRVRPGLEVLLRIVLSMPFALGVLGAHGSHYAAQEGESTLEELLLDQPVESGAALDSLVEALVDRGAEAVSPLFDGLVTGRLPGDERALGGPQKLAMLAALERLPVESVRTRLSSVASDNSNERERLVALRVLHQRIGTGDLDLLLSLAHDSSNDEESDALRDGYAYALRGLLARQPALVSALGPRVDRAPDSLFTASLAEVAMARGRGSIGWLTKRLGSTPARDALTLRALVRVSGTDGPRPTGPQRGAVRRYLRTAEPALVALAARLCETYDDVSAIPTLLDLMDDSREGVAPLAYEVLQSLTDARYRFEPELWAAWWDKENVWFYEEGRGMLSRLDNGRPHVVSQALLSLAQHRIHRHEVHEAVLGVLEREELELRVMAAATLGHLRSADAVAGLAPYLDTEDEHLLAAVRDALRRIVGQDLGPDPEPWLHWGQK